MDEIAFENWVKRSLPFIELEDWRIPVIHREKGRRVLRELYPEYAHLIDGWEKRGITATPDYLLRFKGRPILWVDVKDPQPPIRNPFNLDATKYENYLSVSEDTGIPASIVVFQRGDCAPRMWGYVLPEQYNHIPLSDISTFELEIRRLTKTRT
ncbi:MAG: hypothetical protein ACTSQ8_15130 [Candidatus Helarchaeota archaeon]